MTAGILEAHAAGSVTATSMLVQLPGWDHAVRAAHATPTLDVGLHFNLLVGTPLTPARSLTDQRTGRFLTLRTLVIRALTGRVDSAEVSAECEAQLEALRAAGVRPTHIDSHRHTHALPLFRAAVSRVADAEGLWLRRPLESASLFASDLAAQVHRAVIRAAWTAAGIGSGDGGSSRSVAGSASSGARRGAHAPRRTEHFAGIALQGGTHFDARLDTVLARLAPGTTELMVHPGRADETLRSLDAYTWQREYELAALTARPLRQRLAGSGTALVGFRDLGV